MKALAFANNDMAVVAWTFGGKPIASGLPSIGSMSGQAPKPACPRWRPSLSRRPPRTDHGRRSGAEVLLEGRLRPARRHLQIQDCAGGGPPGEKLQPLPFGPLVSNTIQLSPRYGLMSAYFNRGISPPNPRRISFGNDLVG
jgi:hypothetical protein